MVKYTMKVKVIKYFLQIIVIWNNGAVKKWIARYTFWYIVLLTLCNGDRRIVQWLTVIVLQKYNIRSNILQYWLEIDWYHVVGTLSFMPWVSIFSKNRFIFWNLMFGIWVFYGNANVVFIEKVIFFQKGLKRH